MSEKLAQSADPGLTLPTLPRFVSAGRFAASRDVPSHMHVGSELILVTEGEAQVQVDDQWYEGTAGTLQILPARRYQVQRTLGFTRTVYCVFHAPAVLFDDSMRTLRLSAGDPIYRWLGDLCELYGGPGPTAWQTTSGILLAILSRVNALEQRESTVARLHPAVQRAVAVCEAHAQEPLAMADLARAAGVSTSHLNALCREHLGCGPATYHRRLRLGHAERLLRNPYFQVAEVASHCGFTDTNYFIRLFRAEYGTTPGRWRAAQARRSPEADATAST